MNSEKFDNAKRVFTYEGYVDHIEALFEEGKVTGEVQSDQKLEATKINLHRIHRSDKTVKVVPELESKLKELQEEMDWYLITEGWCGDSAQITPVIAKVAACNPKINFKLILRDENPEIMDTYLTNGSRSVPKLVGVNINSGTESFIWGPRPTNIQERVVQFKKDNPEVPHEEFLKNLHLWYGRDRGNAIQEDFLKMLVEAPVSES